MSTHIFDILFCIKCDILWYVRFFGTIWNLNRSMQEMHDCEISHKSFKVKDDVSLFPLRRFIILSKLCRILERPIFSPIITKMDMLKCRKYVNQNTNNHLTTKSHVSHLKVVMCVRKVVRFCYELEILGKINNEEWSREILNTLENLWNEQKSSSQ